MDLGISHGVAFLFILHKNGTAFQTNLSVTEELFQMRLAVLFSVLWGTKVEGLNIPDECGV